MRILLIHQNFPGQFRQLAPHLERLGHELVAIASHDRPINLSGRVLRYPEPAKQPSLPHGSALWREGLARAGSVARLAEQLDEAGWKPDRILAHSGWGETLGGNIRSVGKSGIFLLGFCPEAPVWVDHLDDSCDYLKLALQKQKRMD